jgi:2-polyprenyl-3-methyl-5-hydroxy-6-metoxy-1,4-benzoquinol methylase
VISTWSSGIADDNMDEAILVDLASIVSRHPWWHARAKLTVALLEELGVRSPARVLDAGCGWGVTLKILEECGFQVTGMDISRRTLQELDRPDRNLVEADLTKPWPGGIEPFDAVLSLDVLEHLDDDVGAVTQLAELVKPGGVLVISVPALPDLFTEFDAIQGHRRRYLPESLRAAFDGTPLTIERTFWWGGWLVPILKRSRGKLRKKAGESIASTYRSYLTLPPWPAPLLLSARFAMEQGRALRGDLDTGTSLFAVARRR